MRQVPVVHMWATVEATEAMEVTLGEPVRVAAVALVGIAARADVVQASVTV
jgi:hypothetical protein